jgi:hypothetical protein
MASKSEFVPEVIVRHGGILVAVIATLLYLGTLSHDFVLDDEIVITKNSLVQQGASGLGKIFSEDSFYGYFNESGKSSLVAGGRYRPLTIAVFAVINDVSHGSATLFHALCIAAYAGTCLLVYLCLVQLFSGVLQSNIRLAAFVGAIIFTVHPVHVEVVANIKGLDETAALLFSLLGLLLLLRSIDTKQSWLSYAGAAAIFAACLSKENAVTFAATIPLVLVVFRKLSWKSAVTTSIPALAAVALYLVTRFAVIGSASSAPSQEFMNNPFLVFTGSGWSPMSFAEKMQVIFATFWKYATLVVLPYPLSHDYYPRQIESTSFTNPNTLMGMLIAVGLILAAVKGTLSKAPWAVGLVVTIASFSVVSNVVFPIGTTMGERFLFMPTFGIVLAVGALLGTAGNTTLRKVGVVATGLFVIAGSVISVARTSAWRNNETLFFADITVSPKSAKLNGACGGTYLTNALKSGSADSAVTLAQQAVPYLSRAIELHPTYGVCYYNRGTCYVILGKYREAVSDARIAMQYNGDKKAAQKLLARALRDLGRQLGERENNIAGALEVLKESWTLYPEDAQTAHLLGIGHGISGKHAESLQWFQQAVEIDPQSPQYLRDLGTAYFLNGNAAKRDEFYAKASSIQPK